MKNKKKPKHLNPILRKCCYVYIYFHIYHSIFLDNICRTDLYRNDFDMIHSIKSITFHTSTKFQNVLPSNIFYLIDSIHVSSHQRSFFNTFSFIFSCCHNVIIIVPSNISYALSSTTPWFNFVCFVRIAFNSFDE